MSYDIQTWAQREWRGVFLDFYGTVAGGDREAVETICRQVIDDHALGGCCKELAVQWGRRYFAAIEEGQNGEFRLLRDIEQDTLVETCGLLVKGFQAGGYIQRLNEYLASPPLFPEVREVLAGLHKPVCIVSNADERELRAAMAAHGLAFDYVVTSESARGYKPQARIFQEALRVTGWSPGDVLHVGDSLHSDVAGAGRLGIRTAWVKRDGRISDIGTATPDLTWPDLRPLLELASLEHRHEERAAASVGVRPPRP